MSRRSHAIAALGLIGGLSACGRLEVLDLLPVDGGPREALEPEAANLQVESNTSMTDYRSPGRECADGVAYAVVRLERDRASLDSAPDPGCLAPGDQALLLSLQGVRNGFGNVGNFELVRIADVIADGVTFAADKSNAYGETDTSDDAIGVGPDSQRVVLQRVPVYSRLEIASGAALTAAPWDGQRGGVLAIRVEGPAVIDGSIRMDGAGYRGGATTEPPESPGQQGESIAGLGSFAFDPNLGGGGGGIADQTTRGCQQDGYPGGGGAHVAAGRSATVMDLCDSVGAGSGGEAYGNAGRLLLGSGGGSGGTDNVRVDNPPGGAGGHGGGILWLMADTIGGSGSISADGAPGVGDAETLEGLGGSTVSCFDHSGPGGGGGGGTVKLTARSASVGRISANGGPGGNGNDMVAGNGGDGGNGLVRLE
jgi:hypothetical protein